MQQDNWDDLRLVLAIGRSLSIAEAARTLQVNQTTVTRRLERCEERFGTLLFDRTRGAVHATEAGLSLMAHAERIESEVLAAQANLSGQDQRVAGTVRLTSVPIVINHLLVPALPSLLQRHRDLRLELIAEPKDLSLTKREADFALRLARPSSEAPVLAQKIGALTYGVYGLQDAAAGPLRWIVYEDGLAHLPHAKWLAEQGAPGPCGVAVNDAETILACLKNGLGHSLLPDAVAERSGGLTRLNIAPAPPARELWLLSHPDHKTLARMQVVAAWLKATIRAATGSDKVSG